MKGSSSDYGYSQTLTLPIVYKSILLCLSTMGYPRFNEISTIRLEGNTVQLVGHNPNFSDQLVYCFWLTI